MDIPQQTPTRLTSDRFKDFFEAVDILYIKDNISGRNQFTAAWPEPALHIFGEELIQFDREGVTDRERRQALEQEAEGRRLALLEVLEGLENKSVFEGTLQLDYVQNIVMQHGRRISLYMYSRSIVDRFVPPSPEEIAADEAARAAAMPPPPKAAKAEPETETVIYEVREDPMDRIKPISVEMDMSPEPEPEDTGDLRPDQIAAMRAQQGEQAENYGDEADKPLFKAGVIPPEPSQSTEEAISVQAEPKPSTPDQHSGVASKNLSIFKISDAGES